MRTPRVVALAHGNLFLDLLKAMRFQGLSFPLRAALLLGRPGAVLAQHVQGVVGLLVGNLGGDDDPPLIQIRAQVLDLVLLEAQTRQGGVGTAALVDGDVLIAAPQLGQRLANRFDFGRVVVHPNDDRHCRSPTH
ncbi:hypothetical protein [Azospirillum sp. sgz301742]